MFYSQVILARKGPLGKIWLAAHFDKKLTKNQIFSTDISDSVESVLNPASPLALRVSGHLMLGIVRIYSRKVKYLMTDCTEAMWKIKLAFRPGNVDMLDPNMAGGGAINLAIDDARFFGNVPIESEFPELENIAFPQFLLSAYDMQKPGEQGLSQVNDENDYNMGNYDMMGSNEYFNSQVGASPMGYDHTLQPASGSAVRSRSSSQRDAHLHDSGAGAGGVSGSGSRRRISDVEMMRGEAGAFGYQRASHLSSVGDRTSSQHMLAEDDIPAFEEQMQQDQSNLLLGDFEAPDFEDQGAMIDEQNEFEAYGGPQDLMEFQDQEQIPGAMTGAEQQGSFEEKEREEEEALRPAKAKATRDKQKAKRQRVVIDERIELSDKEIKRQLADPSNTMRRDPYDPFPTPVSDLAVFKDSSYEVYPMDIRVAMPSSITGMCRELQEILLMTTNKVPLPFPLKRPRVTTDASAAGRASEVHAGRPSVLSLEATRGAGDAESVVHNRVSILHTDSPSFMDASMQDKSSGMEDFGPAADYSYEDMPPQEEQYEEVLQDNEFANFDQEQPPQPEADRGEEYGEEEKGSPPSPVYAGQVPSRPVAQKNSVSESMALVIEQTANKPLGGREGGREEGGKKGGKSPMKSVKEGASERTNQVYDILKDQFRKEGNASFQEISSGVSRRVAASCFLEVLQLKTWGLIDARQEEPYGDIMLTPASKKAVMA